jgi:hypothetical protein
MIMHLRLAAACLLLPILLAGGCAPATDDSPQLTPIDVPAAPGSAQPRLAHGADGTVVLSWLEPAEGRAALRYAMLGTDGWRPPTTLREGDNWFVNWADFPSVVPLTESLWAAHWLLSQPAGGHAYDILMAISEDGGATWSDDIELHDDRTPTEHGFVSLFKDENASAAGVIWLDGRNMVDDAGAMTLRSAVVTADEVVSSTLIDAQVCDCCPTAVAIGSSGPVAVYRNRTDGEIRDIHVTRLVDGRWEPDRPVADDGWKIGGCPVNGPAIAARGDRVAVAWFTAANGEPRVRLAFSADSAGAFDAPIDIAAGNVAGRVAVVLDEAGDAIVSWLEQPRDSGVGALTDLRVRRVSRAGASDRSYTIAQTGAGRPAGFPQMVLRDDRLLLAWTDTRAEPSVVRSGSVAAESIR